MFYIKWALSTWFGLLYLNKYSVTWDAVLKSLLSDKSIKPKLLGNYTIDFGGHEVWVSNPYYSYGGLHYSKGRGYEPLGRKCRPSLSTMKKLDKLHDDLLSERRKVQEAEQDALLKRMFGDNYVQ